MSTAPQHQIVLTFEDAETLQQVLEYIGDSDAPVCITSNSHVTSNNKTYPLWDNFDAAMTALE